MNCNDTAQQAQARGLVPVLIAAGEKKPVEFEWQNKRYTPEQLAKRFDNNPDMNVGLLLGPASGVIDIECDNPQAPADKELLFAGCDKPTTPSYTSKRGPHELYAWNDRLAAIGKATIKWRSVEIRLGCGDKAAQSLLPPSTTGGFTRTWIHDLTIPLARLPDVVIERLLAAAKSEPESKPAVPSNSIEDDYCRRAEWRKILEPHGWQYVGTSDVGQQFRRPGKADGISADIVTAADGRKLLHVFSDAAPPLELGNHNAFDTFALLNHAGDKQAARAALAKAGYAAVTIPLITCAELDSNNYEQKYRIENTMVVGQPMIVAGPKKALKTSILIDLALSLATGNDFLRRLTVNHPCRVMILSGESGLSTLQETARRIARSMGAKLAEIDNLFWSPFLPQFNSQSDLVALKRAIESTGCEVLIVDPAYLCMPGTDAGNLFIQGALLRDISNLCQDNGVGLVLAHHTRKQSKTKNGKENEPPELDDIAWAGFSEFARQWILIGRREPYAPGTGQHELWLNVGGSAGHSRLWAADIDEGTAPRHWKVTLTSADEARAAKSNTTYRERIRAGAREFPAGECKTNILTAAGLRTNPKAMTVFDSMVSDGELAPVQYKRNGTMRDGFALTLSA